MTEKQAIRQNDTAITTLENYITESNYGRLILRTLTEDNMSEEYFEWLQNPEVLQYLEVRHSKQTREKITGFVNNMLASTDNLMMGIFLKENDKHIGNIKIGPVNWLYRRADIGIIIGDQDSWGRGYATEAINIACDIAFNELGLRRVQAGAYASNKGSIRAFEKAGFKHEGILKGHWILNGQPEDSVQFGKLAQ